MYSFIRILPSDHRISLGGILHELKVLYNASLLLIQVIFLWGVHVVQQVLQQLLPQFFGVTVELEKFATDLESIFKHCNEHPFKMADARDLSSYCALQ